MTLELVVATWNLEGRWSDRHAVFVRDLAADVLLLTEVRSGTQLAGFDIHCTAHDMAFERAFAAVMSTKPIVSLPDPHSASAMGSTHGLTFCSSVLPWRTCGSSVWPGETLTEKTTSVLTELRNHLTGGMVWGGDFNHSLQGPEYVGSRAGRAQIAALLDDRGLVAPTSALPHRHTGLSSIDHIAVPKEWQVLSAVRHDASGLSDHDAYSVRVAVPA